jgi:cytochrome c-type biogenesis protein CcmE
MKKSHIIALVMMAAAIVILIISSKDLSSYSNFTSAASKASRVKIVGHLSIDNPVEYRPEVDPNQFSFYMKDEENTVKKVILKQSKPRDFERSEQIVVTGKMNGNDEFEADEILLKCPSKYKEQELALRNKGE